MAQHPELTRYKNISKSQQEQSNKDLAKVFKHLMNDTCGKELEIAMKYERSTYLQSFEVFGRTAMTNILGDPNVAKEIGKLGTYFAEIYE